MTENDRVRAVRIAEKLTLAKFGERLGVQDSAVSKIESGRCAVSQQVRKLICWEFNVNEAWLRTGEGEMYVGNTADLVGALIQEYHAIPESRAMFTHFLSLSQDEQRFLVRFMAGISEEIRNTRPAPPAEPSLEELHAILDAEAEAKKEAGEESSASSLAG